MLMPIRKTESKGTVFREEKKGRLRKTTRTRLKPDCLKGSRK